MYGRCYYLNYVALDRRMIDNVLIERNLERCGHSLIQALSQNLSGETRNHGKPKTR
jgi:hypothetical protein